MNYIVTLFLIIIVCSFLRIGRMKDVSELKCFDVKNTLPLRGIMALLIIADHIVMFCDTPVGFFTTFAAPSVATFFFISGYGLMCSYQNRGGA